MVCPNCRTSNRPGAKFCAACGRSLLDTATDAPTLPRGLAVPPSRLAPYRLRDVSPTLVTRPGNGAPTQLLGAPVAYEPLPEGAILADRYYLHGSVEAASGTFRYLAEDVDPAAPYGPDCLIQESSDAAALAGELAVWSAVRAGDGVRPPYDAFTLTLRPGAVTRVFVVSSGGRSLADLTWPDEPAAALKWSASLARGLAAVHEAGLSFGALDASRIRGDGETIYLADFETVVPAAAREDIEADVRALAALLRRLTATGAPAELASSPLAARLDAVISGDLRLGAAELAEALANGEGAVQRPGHADLRTGRRTDVGRVRELNEDSLLALDFVWMNQSVTRSAGLFVVADGMGGHEGGELASGLLIEAIARQAGDLLARVTALGEESQDYGAWLVEAIQAGNDEIYERGQTSHLDMGTTVVAALIVGDEAYVAHVGDSRAYLLNASGIEQITVDHSLVESLVATNQISREEARRHPQSHVIYRTIGDRPHVDVDLNPVHLAPGEMVLLCSDGLSGMMTDEAIHRLAMGAVSPQAACDALVDAANQAGGEDNITAVLIRLEALPERR